MFLSIMHSDISLKVFRLKKINGNSTNDIHKTV